MPAGKPAGWAAGACGQPPRDDVTVLTGRPAPVRGVYYLSASLTIQSINGDRVSCFLAPDPARTSLQFTDPAGTEIASLSLTGAVTLDAGQSPSIMCQDTQREPETRALQVNMNAVLISNSTGPLTAGP